MNSLCNRSRSVFQPLLGFVGQFFISRAERIVGSKNASGLNAYSEQHAAFTKAVHQDIRSQRPTPRGATFPALVAQDGCYRNDPVTVYDPSTERFSTFGFLHLGPYTREAFATRKRENPYSFLRQVS